MTETVLTLDLGNSALKLRRWRVEAGELLALGGDRCPWDGPWRDLLETGSKTDLALIASVVAARRLTEVTEALGAGGLEVRANPDPGMTIDCRDEFSIGRDRLFAARGAAALVGGPAIVVDAGTALTVDAVGGQAGLPVFLGGAIAPGTALLAGSLARGAEQLVEIEPRPGVAALGKDTREALLAGVIVGFRGAARELVRCVAAEAGLESSPIVLTGGGRAPLEEPSTFGTSEVRVEPDLVHLGLLAAAGFDVAWSR